jgi:hypothetical protein
LIKTGFQTIICDFGVKSGLVACRFIPASAQCRRRHCIFTGAAAEHLPRSQDVRTAKEEVKAGLSTADNTFFYTLLNDAYNPRALIQ